MSRDEVLKDFEKILDLSYKYCDKDMQDKEFEDLDETVMYPVSRVDKSKKDKNHRVYQFLLNDKGKFCVFYLDEDNSAKLQSMEIPNKLIN